MFYYYFSSIISKLYFKSRRYYLTSSTCFYDKSNIIYCYLIEYLLVCEGHDRFFTQSILIYRYNSSKCFYFKVYCSPQSPSFFDLCLSCGYDKRSPVITFMPRKYPKYPSFFDTLFFS